MEKVVGMCESALESEVMCEANETSLKIPKGEDSRGHLMDGGKKPEKQFQECLKCKAPYMHEPPSNIAVRGDNNKMKSEWMKLNDTLT